MSKRVKESGHSFRKKKAKPEQEIAALSGTLNRFLITQSESSDTDIESEKQSETQSEKQTEPIEHDPYTWLDVFPDSFREQIVKMGMPPMPKHREKYPQRNGCSFSEKFFYATHADETPYKREWLIYSESSDSVYCLFCVLFNRNANLFCAVGRVNTEWRNLKRDAAAHENSLKHHSKVGSNFVNVCK